MKARPTAQLEDLIDACVMESYFHEHMAERDLLIHDAVAPYLTAYAPDASAAQQRDLLSIIKREDRPWEFSMSKEISTLSLLIPF